MIRLIFPFSGFYNHRYPSLEADLHLCLAISYALQANKNLERDAYGE